MLLRVTREGSGVGKGVAVVDTPEELYNAVTSALEHNGSHVVVVSRVVDVPVRKKYLLHAALYGAVFGAAAANLLIFLFGGTPNPGNLGWLAFCIGFFLIAAYRRRHA